MYASGVMVIFGEMFREVAEKETRVITTFDDPKLGSESYALVDLYCIAPDCDCRRVMINVIRDRDTKHLATINWAFDGGDPDQGPFLDRLNVQSELSDALLKMVKETVLPDKRYVERLERHYRMVKEAVADPNNEVHKVLTDVTRKGPENVKKARTRFVGASTDAELADIWKKVGLDVPRELVDQTIRRGRRMVPFLGAFLTDQDLWEADGEECWAPVHALFLLQAIQDSSATSYVVDALHRGLGSEWLGEYGDNLILSLGPQGVEPIWAVASDPNADGSGRFAAVSGLGVLGLAHEDLRPNLISRFRGLATLILDKPDQDNEETDPEILECLLENLACLHDEASKALIDRAYEDTRFDLDLWYKGNILDFYSAPCEKILSDLRVDPLLHFDPEELGKLRGQYEPEDDEPEEEEFVPRPIVTQEAKVGRNDPCPCGSGKKYKKCCLSS